jgi:acetyl esterase/lipase
MILGQISYLDCVVFLIFLVPQLLLRVNTFELLSCFFKALPFFRKNLASTHVAVCFKLMRMVVFYLPYRFISERYFTPKKQRSPFVQKASPFQDIVIRCVRYAFARFPAKIGRVFFSKPVALPFMRFRMLRHGYLHPPIRWKEISLQNCKGIWIIYDVARKPDLVIYYCHGGGFSMGSSYFYLEFLLAWASLLKDNGYQNPAVFALEYDLVPDAAYPTQLEQTVTGYNHVCTTVDDPSRICVAGDSAGATLILTLLLYIGKQSNSEDQKPGFATLISPWTTLFSSHNRNTASDFLDASSLHLYGRQYAGSDEKLNDPLVSPGVCRDVAWWQKASPTEGYGVLYGSEELLGPELRDLIALWRKSGCAVSVREEPGAIHAWPVATLFLSDTQAERQKGLKDLVKMIRQAIEIQGDP